MFKETTDGQTYFCRACDNEARNASGGEHTCGIGFEKIDKKLDEVLMDDVKVSKYTVGVSSTVVPTLEEMKDKFIQDVCSVMPKNKSKSDVKRRLEDIIDASQAVSVRFGDITGWIHYGEERGYFEYLKSLDKSSDLTEEDK